MNFHAPESAQNIGIGQAVVRKEDATLVRGEGRYTDDISLPNQAHAVMVRSTQAHGTIRGIDTAAARAMPGVLAVYTGADLTGYGPLKPAVKFPNRDGSEMRQPPRPALPTDKVRFVGDPVACVVAETVQQARDAAEAVMVDIDPLPVVTEPHAAVADRAPLVYDEARAISCSTTISATPKRWRRRSPLPRTSPR